MTEGKRRSTQNGSKHSSTAKSLTVCDLCKAANAKCNLSPTGCKRCLSLGASCQFSSSQRHAVAARNAPTEVPASELSGSGGGTRHMSAAHSSSGHANHGNTFNNYDDSMLQYPLEMLGSGPPCNYPLEGDSSSMMASLQYDAGSFDGLASESSFAGYDPCMQDYWNHPVTGMSEQSTTSTHYSNQIFQREDAAGHPRKAAVNPDCRQQALDVLASLQ